ncbi:MAG: transcription termination/antitermination protein NusG [Planctomycetota bacterium]
MNLDQHSEHEHAGAADFRGESASSDDLATGGEAAAKPTKPKARRKPKATVVAEEPATPRNLRALRAGEANPRATARSLGVETTRVSTPTQARPQEEVAEGELPMFRDGMDWFVLRVASNKEDSVRSTLLRKVQIEGMENLVGRIMVPTEKIKVLGKQGKQTVTESKLYPGYVFVEMRLEPDGRIPQDVFFLIKETTGVGDFVGTAGRPTPMSVSEVEKMLFDSKPAEEAPQLRMDLHKGDNVTIKEGAFQGYEGTIDEVFPDKGQVRVLVTIFGRQAPIDMEYWFVQRVEK